VNGRSCGNDGLWTAWKTKNRFPTAAHEPLEIAGRDSHIPAAPARERHGKVEIQRQDSQLSHSDSLFNQSKTKSKMKTIIKLMTACIIVCSISTAFAQNPSKDSTMQNPQPAQTNPTMTKDYVTMMNGKMMEYKDGKMMELKGDYSCSNGCKVSSKGMLQKKDGTTQQLKEGDKVYKDGRMEMAKAETPQK